MRIAVVGAGPAGMIAAVAAARGGAREVVLFDRNREPGRKLLATGNGRCNLSNLAAAPSSYASREPAALAPLLERYPPARVREILFDLGIPTVATDDGWVYPASLSAANVVAVLTGVLAEAGVRIEASRRIVTLERDGEGFRLGTAAGPVEGRFDRVIAATGGPAFPNLGADIGLLPALERLGHRPIPFRPALAPLLTDARLLVALRGVKCDVGTRVTLGGCELGRSFGNVIFTEYGVNGPGVMNLSHLVDPASGGAVTLTFDFIPGEGRATLERLFFPRTGSALPYRGLLLSLLPAKTADFFLARWGLPPSTACRDVDRRRFRAHLEDLAALSVPVRGVRGFEAAQVAAGGIPLAECDLLTMESRPAPGLYLAGELLDVTGPCGGYNLHWAWVTGLAAGESGAAAG